MFSAIYIYIFLQIKPNFSLIKNHFLLTNFYNDKQIQESLKIIFKKPLFIKLTIKGVSQLVRACVCSPEVTSLSLTNLRVIGGLHGR